MDGYGPLQVTMLPLPCYATLLHSLSAALTMNKRTPEVASPFRPFGTVVKTRGSTDQGGALARSLHQYIIIQ